MNEELDIVNDETEPELVFEYVIEASLFDSVSERYSSMTTVVRTFGKDSEEALEKAGRVLPRKEYPLTWKGVIKEITQITSPF